MLIAARSSQPSVVGTTVDSIDAVDTNRFLTGFNKRRITRMGGDYIVIARPHHTSHINVQIMYRSHHPCPINDSIAQAQGSKVLSSVLALLMAITLPEIIRIECLKVLWTVGDL